MKLVLPEDTYYQAITKVHGNNVGDFRNQLDLISGSLYINIIDIDWVDYNIYDDINNRGEIKIEFENEGDLALFQLKYQ